MSMLDSLRSKLGIDPDADSYVDDTEENVFPGGQGAAAAQEYTQQQEIKQHSNKVVNINATTQLQVVLVKPERFDDASSIADQLNAKHTVVLNLESASKEVSRRLIDFLSGVAYANNGHAVRGFVPPQNDDERRLMRRVEELCRVAVSRGIPRYTGFLSDREQSLAQAACNKAGCSCIRFWGGFDAAERRVLCIEPPDAWQEEPLAYLQCTAYGDKLPTHRDYLGAILGLGLERSCVGDLLADPERADTFYAVILADKQEFINAELTGAGHCTVHTACIDALPARLAESRERTLQEATVPSLRADAVLAAMLHTSRTRAAEYIAVGRVEINHLPLKAAHETAYAADIFTVRGVGRFKLAAIGGKSRKDRLFISFYQY